MRITPVAAAFALTLIAAPASAASKKVTVQRLFSVPAGTSLSVSNVNGPVVVNSWDRPQIQLVAEKKVRARSEAAADQALQQLKIVAEHRANTLRISTRHPRSSGGVLSWISGTDVQASVHYRLTVPRNFDVSAETVNGSVTVTGVNGTLDLETVNGAIRLERCAGAIEASTVNGSIKAELLGTLPRRMKFDTVNGAVSVALPSNVQADLDVKTVNGGISSALPVSQMSSSRRQLRGQINGGGPAVVVRTTNGSVSIRESGL